MIDIIVCLIIIISAIIGMKRGFLRSALGIASTVLSIVISLILYRPISDSMYKSSIGDTVRESVEKFLLEKTSQMPLADIALEKAVETFSMLIMSVASFVLVVIAGKILVKFLFKTANLIAKLPLIKQANSLLGLVAGALSGLLVCYIITGVFAAFDAGENSAEIIKQIENSQIASVLYENNVISNVLTTFRK